MLLSVAAGAIPLQRLCCLDEVQKEATAVVIWKGQPSSSSSSILESMKVAQLLVVLRTLPVSRWRIVQLLRSRVRHVELLRYSWTATRVSISPVPRICMDISSICMFKAYYYVLWYVIQHPTATAAATSDPTDRGMLIPKWSTCFTFFHIPEKR